MGYDFKEKTIDEFTAQLASKTSVPGGGGAAALVASVGVALSSMAAAFTVGKPRYAEVNADMERILSECEDLRREALMLMDRDAEAFEPMSQIYKMPKDTEEQRQAKASAMEACLKDAAAVPMELMELCCRGIELSHEVSRKGSEMLISDAGCSAAALQGALRSAYLNVLINTSSMKDRACAERIETRAEELYGRGTEQAEAVYEAVLERIKG